MHLSESALKSLFTPANLKLAWRKFCKDGVRGTGAGVDRVTAEIFESKLTSNLRSVALRVSSGEYNFSPLRPTIIPKSSGDFRVICVPTISDRLVQRILVDYLMSLPSAERLRNDASFGFLKSMDGSPKGVNAARDRAIALRKTGRWAYKSDVSAFFDNIPRDQLILQTMKLFRKPSLKGLISRAVDCEIDSRNATVQRVVSQQGIRTGHGVRQGMPISPFFSNVILHEFDQEMVRRGFKMVRYADDFIVLANSERDCFEADRVARFLLAKLGLSLPTLSSNNKTKIIDPDGPVDFLGLSFRPTQNGTYELALSDSQLAKIKNRLGTLRDIDYLVAERLTVPGIAVRLENMIAGYRSAYSCASNASALEGIFETSKLSSLTSIYRSILGATVFDSLSQKQLMVLGLQNFPQKSSKTVGR
ncbi:hypothetical protein ELI23_00925 [Rhizobium leguminosarum]|nr:hypothetical protein ELI22_00925 [Rhizobium leguminosarum]TAV92467.1 hypothetical protein ELI21_00925 [Rhizobium leguminosarum]TAW33537.1 hypothetical protein ELI23_00925 [Rhizobium leguminosarum]